MAQVLTVSCKLNPKPEQASKIDATLKAFADACTWINLSTPEKLTNKTNMQKLVYQDVRALFGLSANLTIRAIARVCANRKTARLKGKPVKSFAPTSADYDARIFSFNEKNWSVSLTLLDGREHIPLAIGNYQRHLLAGKKPTSATLARRKDGSIYIQIQVDSQPPEPDQPDGCLGVDLGRTDIAHTSTGESYCGQQLKQVRDKHARTRAQLQHKASKGTRSTRRRCRELQKRLSGRERRFQANVNHTISYRLVQQVKTLGWSIALEDLTGIRERTNDQPRNKTERRRSNSWAFFQLRQFLAYKAIRAGVSLVLVNPAYTSQTCHCCYRIGERQGKRFKCGGCGWHGDADLNGARVISQLGRLVNSPRGPWMACHLEGS
jgi:IS605 OrfB family transposase